MTHRMISRIVSLLLACATLAGCSQEIPPETPSTEPLSRETPSTEPPSRETPSTDTAEDAAVAGPMLGQPCVLASGSRADSSPPRIFLEVASLEGDVTSILHPQKRSGEDAGVPNTFAQTLATRRWKRVSVHNVMASDGVRQALPWEFEPLSASTTCPASERWVFNMTPHVRGESVHIELEILPAPPLEVAADAWHVPDDCGVRTTLVARDQQLVVLANLPVTEMQQFGSITTVTPYLIREDADLHRLAECKKQQAGTSEMQGSEAVTKAPASPR